MKGAITQSGSSEIFSSRTLVGKDGLKRRAPVIAEQVAVADGGCLVRGLGAVLRDVGVAAEDVGQHTRALLGRAQAGKGGGRL